MKNLQSPPFFNFFVKAQGTRSVYQIILKIALKNQISQSYQKGLRGAKSDVFLFLMCLDISILQINDGIS